MVFKVFLDVNILLDFFLKRQNFDSAQKILQLAKERKIEVYVSPSIIQTTSYYLQRNFSSTDCKQFFLGLLEVVNLLDSTSESLFQALNSSISDIEDAIHYYTALECQMDFIISNDIEFQKLLHKNLKVVSQNEFLIQLDLSV